MKNTIALALLFLAQNTFAQDSTCYTEVQNAAALEAATQLRLPVQNVKVAHWQETPINTRGNVDVSISMYSGQKLVHLIIKAHASDCSLLSIYLVDESSIDPIVMQAIRYKLAVRDTVWMSEGDSEWFPFFTAAEATPVSRSFSQASIRKALDLDADTHIEFYTHEEAIKFVESDPDMQWTDRHNYDRLKTALLKDFTEVRGVKVGNPDSGALELIIFGRTSDGRLIGVKTITVET